MITNINTDHFYSLFDKYGIIQFAKGLHKDLHSGYAIEDQARALILALSLNDTKLIQQLTQIIKESIAPEGGVYMSRDEHGQILPEKDNFSEASAEVLWALGEYSACKKGTFGSEINYLINGLKESHYPRTLSYALLGLVANKDKKYSQIFADKLINFFHLHSASGWLWFEDTLYYANALMPWALLRAFALTGKKLYKKIAVASLDFLLVNTKHNGSPIAIGNKGWWTRGQNMPLFDQQPIDISYLCLALLDFFKITGEEKYLAEAKFYFSWFQGQNLLKAPMTTESGACFDGLTPLGPNSNSGAESTICYLLVNCLLPGSKNYPQY